MKLKDYLLVVVVCAFLSACSSDYEDQAPTNENPKSKVFLKKLTYNNGNFYYQFKYDENKLEEITINDLGAGDHQIEKSEFFYNDRNRLTRVEYKSQIHTGNQPVKLTLIYNHRGQLKKVLETIGPGVQNSYTFNHIGRNLVRQISKDETVVHSFNANGSIDNQRFYSNLPPKYLGQVTYENDANHSTFKHVRQPKTLFILFNIIRGFNNHKVCLSMPVHNVTRRISSLETEQEGTITYEYNEEGYPITAKVVNMDRPTDILTYEYY